MKILFIGDPHLDTQTPISRLDDYRQLTLDKLHSLLKVCLDNNVEALITTGDVFHRYDIPISYIIEVLDVLAKFKENNIKVYSLIGNHDLDRDNMKFFYRMPLNLLFSSGLMEHLTVLNLPKADIYGLDFTESISKFRSVKLDKTKTNILVMHYATDNTVAGGSIPRNDLIDFHIVVSGHDHTYYTPEDFHPTILRPGSFTRRTKEAYNLTRKIVYYIYDTETDNILENSLPTKPAKEVFRNEVYASPTMFTDGIIDFTEAFEDLYKETEVKSIYDIIEILKLSNMITTDIYNNIIQYLKDRGA